MSGASKAKFRVLVVDDEADVRKILSTVLRGEFEVTTANNGLDALLKLNRHEPDLVIADVLMPLLDGYELTGRIRESPGYERIPIILVSALDDREEMKKGYAKGADVFLPKPFDPDRVVRNVRLSFEGSSPRIKKFTIEHIEELDKAAQDATPSRETIGKEYDVIKSYSSGQVRKPVMKPAVVKTMTPPAKTASAAAPPPKPSTPAAPPRPDIKVRVMVVDDDPDIVEFVESALKGGYEVVPAEDGMDAVKKIPATEPDVFVVDGMMPKMSGYQLVEILKGSSETSRCPVVFISAKNLARDRAMLMKQGVDIFVPKPFSPAQLLEALRKVTSAPTFAPRPKTRDIEGILHDEGERLAGVEGIRQRQSHWKSMNLIQDFLKENKKKDPFGKG